METPIIIVFASVLFIIGIVLIFVLNKNRLSLMSNINDFNILNYEEFEQDLIAKNSQRVSDDFEKYVSTILETLLKSQKEILQNTLDLNIQYNLKQSELKKDQFTMQDLSEISSDLEFKAKKVVEIMSEIDEEEDEQKRRAEERINKLRNLSYNMNTLDASNEYENVPAYVRRNLELFGNNKLTNVEDFYSKVSVKKDENNQTQISNITTFLDGENPSKAEYLDENRNKAENSDKK